MVNPYWDYSQKKIAAEDELMRAYREEGFPITIIRPSLTFGHTAVPLVLNSWQHPYTAVARLRAGKPVVVPGDGLSLWTITHNTDFAKGLVGLIGHPSAIGHAFHITSDEVLTWNQLFQQAADAAGVANPKLVHIASDFIVACFPETVGTLLGDKSHSVVFDNSKIKRFVPDFVATTRFRDGVEKSLRWFDADPKRQTIEEVVDQRYDKLVACYERGLAAARQECAAAKRA
jgi:nucleoside-diphosphate-sugar epimerase